jgi:hypothetical protein
MKGALLGPLECNFVKYKFNFISGAFYWEKPYQGDP